MSWTTITGELDSFPPENTPVFIRLKDGRHGMAEHVYAGEDAGGYLWALMYEPPYVKNGKWVCDNSEFDDLDVVAWHPLPELPMEDTQ